MRRTAITAIILAAMVTLGACEPTEGTATDSHAKDTTALAETWERPPPTGLAFQLDAIYPGILDHADDWAHYTCREIERGERDPATYVAQMFAGGSRLDPTPEQVAALLAVIEPTC